MIHDRIVSFTELAEERRISLTNMKRLVNGEENMWIVESDGKLDYCCFKQLMTQKDLAREQRSHCIIRNYPQIQALLALHPTADIMRLSNFYYTVYYNYQVERLHHQNICNYLDLYFEHILPFIEHLHSINIIHNYVHECMFYGIYTVNNVKYPLIRINGHLKKYTDFKTEAEYSESPYPAPLQIILEILSSSIEPNVIEYKSFRKKFTDFWQYLCMRTCGFVCAKVCQEYVSQYHGAIDYIDYIIQRYCILTDDNDSIKKDKSKAFGYLRDIDLFGFAMSVHTITKNGRLLKDEHKKRISGCIMGTYEVIPDMDQYSFRKPFDGVYLMDREQPKPKQIEVIQQEIPESKKVEITQPARASILQRPTPQKLDLKIMPIERPEKKQIAVPPPPPIEPKKEVKKPKDSTIKFSNGVFGEIVEGGGIKKVKVQGVERIVRSESCGEYILWKGDKLYLPKD
jgi:hypothetical protein